jgi:hypothetical protein
LATGGTRTVGGIANLQFAGVTSEEHLYHTAKTQGYG